ncbi:hypothetical protein BC629DRAFT_1441032 [Irpex lacteus]|nr:hypothetical protein BC629DRAFT_1441032 [Irpex lacteus]
MSVPSSENTGVTACDLVGAVTQTLTCGIFTVIFLTASYVLLKRGFNRRLERIYRRMIREGVRNGGNRQLESVLVLLIESGAIYCVSSIDVPNLDNIIAPDDVDLPRVVASPLRFHDTQISRSQGSVVASGRTRDSRCLSRAMDVSGSAEEQDGVSGRVSQRSGSE